MGKIFSAVGIRKLVANVFAAMALERFMERNAGNAVEVESIRVQPGNLAEGKFT